MRLRRYAGIARFGGSADYWERRYRAGDTSGGGSYGQAAEYKAGFLNDFVVRHEVHSVVELGCGDGAQLALVDYPSYIGLDVSPTAVDLCRSRFTRDDSKSFEVYRPGANAVHADLALSLDVLYHLVEQPVFEQYLEDLTAAASSFVVVYATDDDRNPRFARHVRHRRFTGLVEQLGWRLTAKVARPDPGVEDFFVFEPASPSQRPQQQ